MDLDSTMFYYYFFVLNLLLPYSMKSSGGIFGQFFGFCSIKFRGSELMLLFATFLFYGWTEMPYFFSQLIRNQMRLIKCQTINFTGCSFTYRNNI